MHLPSSITSLLGSPGSNNKQITNLHLAQVNSASHPQRGKNWYMQFAKLIGAMKSYKHLKWQDTNLHSISVSLHNKIALHYLHNIHFPLFYWHQFDSWRLIRWTSQEPCGLLQSKSQQNHTKLEYGAGLKMNYHCHDNCTMISKITCMLFSNNSNKSDPNICISTSLFSNYFFDTSLTNICLTHAVYLKLGNKN